MGWNGQEFVLDDCKLFLDIRSIFHWKILTWKKDLDHLRRFGGECPFGSILCDICIQRTWPLTSHILSEKHPCLPTIFHDLLTWCYRHCQDLSPRKKLQVDRLPPLCGYWILTSYVSSCFWKIHQTYNIEFVANDYNRSDDEYSLRLLLIWSMEIWIHRS